MHYNKNMRFKGIERRKKLKDEISAFPILCKIMKGEQLDKENTSKKEDVRKAVRKEDNFNA